MKICAILFLWMGSVVGAPKLPWHPVAGHGDVKGPVWVFGNTYEGASVVDRTTPAFALERVSSTEMVGTVPKVRRRLVPVVSNIDFRTPDPSHPAFQNTLLYQIRKRDAYQGLITQGTIPITRPSSVDPRFGIVVARARHISIDDEGNALLLATASFQDSEGIVGEESLNFFLVNKDGSLATSFGHRGMYQLLLSKLGISFSGYSICSSHFFTGDGQWLHVGLTLSPCEGGRNRHFLLTVPYYARTFGSFRAPVEVQDSQLSDNARVIAVHGYGENGRLFLRNPYRFREPYYFFTQGKGAILEVDPPHEFFPDSWAFYISREGHFYMDTAFIGELNNLKLRTHYNDQGKPIKSERVAKDKPFQRLPLFPPPGSVMSAAYFDEVGGLSVTPEEMFRSLVFSSISQSGPDFDEPLFVGIYQHEIWQNSYRHTDCAANIALVSKAPR